MRSIKFGKVIGTTLSLAMLMTSVVLGSMGNPMKVEAATKSPKGFMQKDDLLLGYMENIKFGPDNTVWYNMGDDGERDVILFCNPKNPAADKSLFGMSSKRSWQSGDGVYYKMPPNATTSVGSIYPVHYGGSYVRKYLNSTYQKKFTASQLGLLKDVRIDINDPYYYEAYYVQDKFYIPEGPHLNISPGGVGYASEFYVGVGEHRQGLKFNTFYDSYTKSSYFGAKDFWLYSNDTTLKDKSELWYWKAPTEKSSSKVNSVSSYTQEKSIVPVCHIKTDKFAFASKGDPEVSATGLQNYYQLRFVDRHLNIETQVVRDCEKGGFQVTRNAAGTNQGDVYFCVQVLEGEQAGFYSKNLTNVAENSLITFDEIRERLGYDDIMLYPSIFAWLETRIDGVIYMSPVDFTDTYDNHCYNKYVSLENGCHKLICSACHNVKPKQEEVFCSGGTATCVQRAKCEFCRGYYGVLGEHSFGEQWSQDGASHWKECSECKLVDAKASHTDENKDNKCDICGYVMHKHSVTQIAAVKATCTQYGVKAYYKCGCGKLFADLAATKEITNLAIWKTSVGRIDKLTHTYSTTWKSNDKNHWHVCTMCGATKDGAAHKLETTYTKATKTTDGKKETKCSVCGKVTANVPIYAAKTVKLSATSFTYDGKVKTPTLVVRDSKGNTITEKDYSISYSSGRKNVGIYNVKIVFKRNYTGSKVMSFSVLPQKTEIKSIAARTKAFNVKWDAMTKQTSGYQIQYSTSNKFASDNKLVNITSNATVSKTIKNLKANQKYYVRVRTYKTVNGKNYYSHWSAIKSVTTK